MPCAFSNSSGRPRSPDLRPQRFSALRLSTCRLRRTCPATCVAGRSPASRSTTSLPMGFRSIPRSLARGLWPTELAYNPRPCPGHSSERAAPRRCHPDAAHRNDRAAIAVIKDAGHASIGLEEATWCEHRQMEPERMTLKTISLVLTVVVLAAVPASATVSIYLSAQGFAQPVPPGSHVAWTLSAFRSAQDTNTEAVDLLITMTVPSVLSNFIGSGDRWNCTTSSTATVCGTSLAAATRFSTPLQVEFDAPTTADGGRFVIPATLATSLPNTHPEISAKIEVNTYRTFAVTTTDDFGAGSLREAIGRANDRCDRTVDCLISFAGPMTIEPRSPLPAATAWGPLVQRGPAQGTAPG